MQIVAGGCWWEGDEWMGRRTGRQTKVSSRLQRCSRSCALAKAPEVPLPPTPHLWGSVPSGPEAVKAEQAGLLLGPGRPSQPASCRQPLTSSCR